MENHLNCSVRTLFIPYVWLSYEPFIDEPVNYSLTDISLAPF